MELIRKAFSPFVRLAKLFFRSQLTLQMRGGLRLAWVDPDQAGKPTPEMQRVAREEADLELIVHELAALLNDDPDTRGNLRHLSFLEQSLRQQGLQALHQVPVAVLRRALDQFEGLVTNWGPRGLASLRSRMSVAVSVRGDEDEEDAAVQAVPLVPPARRVTATES